MTHTAVMIDPWTFQDWADKTGVAPDTIMSFIAWDKGQPEDNLIKTKELGLKYHMITWEPWAGYDATSTTDYSCDSIASGAHDTYIRDFGKLLNEAGYWSSYIRFAHEANIDAYPWHADPAAYIAAWKHVTKLLKETCPTTRMVWTPNGEVFVKYPKFLTNVKKYWPGSEYVDFLGCTAINFSGLKPATAYTQRSWGMAHDLSHPIKKIILPEVNTTYEGRAAWFKDMQYWTVPMKPHIQMVCVSQPPLSIGEIILPTAGDVTWRVEDDAATKDLVKEWFTQLAS